MEYKYRNIQIQSNMKGHYEKRIDISPQELDIPHNHRRIFFSEVVFDIDTHIRIISDKIHDFISSNLIKDNISHQVWDTSRSPHIHAFFKDMNLYTQEVRKDIRLLILKHYSGKYFNWIDKSKASENNMIRDFGGLHEITGKPKTMIYGFVSTQANCGDDSVKGAYPSQNRPETQSSYMENALNPAILEQLRVLYQQRNKVPETAYIKPTEANLKAMQEFITYCCENQHTHDGREMILFKNVAIACLLLKYDTNQRTRIYHTIARNCRGRHVSELISWDVFMQKQKNLYFSWKQIQPFYNKEGIRIT